MAYPQRTFAEIIPQVRDYIGEKGTADGFWSDTSEILPVCNFVCLDIASRVKYPYGNTHAALTQNASSITLPVGFLCMDYKERSGEAALLLNINSTWIKATPAKTTTKAETAILTATGDTDATSVVWWQKTPAVSSSVYCRVIEFYPKYTGTTVSDPGYYVNYVKIPTALTGNATSGTGNELTDLYFDEICTGAAWMLLLKTCNTNLVNYFWQKYEAMLPAAELNEYERLQLGARTIPDKVMQVGG